MKRIFTKFSVLTFLCFLFNYTAFAQNITVKGTVTDGGDKTTIPAVSVQVKGTTTGAQTDVNGNYSISAPANATLVFTYVGYTTQEVAVNNRTTVNVVLASASQQLDQVVVVGYGTQRKIDVTGAVTSVKGEDISKQASVNPVSALQGKVAGVSITNVGKPGASPQITIRGTGTIYGNTNVLYVVDGVWYDDISFLNPADIANISILKDASSQSIYGIRAANGVVLVTTVRGKN
jgi:TonB-dependent SusC/RagA subfamily outer membrane receptor